MLNSTNPSRILSLDVLRGVAVLGILIMNIQHFSMPMAAYSNPTAYGDFEGINRWIWILSHMLASEKFMSIFSMLFGAGVVLFNEGAIQKGMPDVVLHYRRMGWLLLFGLLHAYLLWSGDILVAYSLCGMLVFVFRKKNNRALLSWAALFFMVPLILEQAMAFSLPFWPEENLIEMKQNWMPDEEQLAATLEAYRGSFLDQLKYRSGEALFMQTGIFLMSTFWRITSMMLLGMVLYRRGILSAQRSSRFYGRLALAGLGAGYMLSGIGVHQVFAHDWEMSYSMFRGHAFNYVGSLGVALGYTALVMLICRSSSWVRFTSPLAALGRMAFTNYILMSVLAGMVFYGHGFGLFGSVERQGQVLILAGIWVLILLGSPLYLKYRHQGPLEWLWRKLTYRGHS